MVTTSGSKTASKSEMDRENLIAALRAGTHASADGSANYTGVQLTGADLSGTNLTNVDLSGADLSGANLTDADLSGANLFQATLAGAMLVGAKLRNAELTGCDLSEANLDDADLERAGLGKSKLRGASLLQANLEHATLSLADLTNAKLSYTRLQHARLREATLAGADFNTADLRSADLSLAKAPGASFRNADLRGVRLRMIGEFEQADWIGVDIRDVNFAGGFRLRRFIMDQNYIMEFRQSGTLGKLLYYPWKFTSDCGRSLYRWTAMVSLITILFAGAYQIVGIDYGDYETWLSPLYFSIVTLTTVGYGDAHASSLAGQIVVIIQISVGYLMLGGLLSIFSNKMARRAD